MQIAFQPNPGQQYMEELLCILKNNGKSTAKIETALSWMEGLAYSIAQTGGSVTSMKDQFAAMPEIRRHPLKKYIESSVGLLETMGRSLKTTLDAVEMNLRFGCAEIVEAYDRDGASALDIRFYGNSFKSSLYDLRNTVVRMKAYCDGAISTIERFAHLPPKFPINVPFLQILARMLTRQPQREQKRLKQLFGAPFIKEKSRLSELQNDIEQAIDGTKSLEQGVGISLKERVMQQPTLAAQLAEAKKRVQPPASHNPGRTREAQI
jgi:hypothetical protein